MDKRIIAIILALIVAVPAAVCMAQYDSDAAYDYTGSTEANPVVLNSVTVNVGGTMKVGLKTNETAYVGYDNYEMSFNEGKGNSYTDSLGTFGKNTDTPASVAVDLDKTDTTVATLELARDGTDKNGAFTLTVTGKSTTSGDGIDVYIKCSVKVTEDNNEVEDAIYYKLNIKVIGADGSITFDENNKSITVIAGQLADTELSYTSPTNFDVEYVYAKGLPVGLNIVKVSDGKLKITGMANTKTESPASVSVVIRDDKGVEYVGSIQVTVSAAPSTEYNISFSQGVKGSNDVYSILFSEADNVTMTITGTEQAFTGSVSIYKQDSNNYVRTVQDADEGTPGDTKVTTYKIPVEGVGSYIIEILNGNGELREVTLNVIPASTGSVGLIVIGN